MVNYHEGDQAASLKKLKCTPLVSARCSVCCVLSCKLSEEEPSYTLKSHGFANTVTAMLLLHHVHYGFVTIYSLKCTLV